MLNLLLLTVYLKLFVWSGDCFLLNINVNFYRYVVCFPLPGKLFGPTISGILVDKYGFRETTLGFFVVFLLNIIVGCLELCYNYTLNTEKSKVEYELLK
jgi:hypothetical protein